MRIANTVIFFEVFGCNAKTLCNSLQFTSECTNFFQQLSELNTCHKNRIEVSTLLSMRHMVW